MKTTDFHRTSFLEHPKRPIGDEATQPEMYVYIGIICCFGGTIGTTNSPRRIDISFVDTKIRYFYYRIYSGALCRSKGRFEDDKKTRERIKRERPPER